MPNIIALASNYTDLLDEVFKGASVTAQLAGDVRFTREGANARTIYYPAIETTGLGDYNRNTGYPSGGVSVSWKSAEFNYDRGTKIMVDVMDDQETFNIAAGRAGAHLMRTKVAPEADAFTFATLAGLTGITTPAAAELANAGAFLAALQAAEDELDDLEVPATDRHLYAIPALINSLNTLDSYKSQKVMQDFASVNKVPKSRFISAIEMLDGTSENELDGGYVPASGAVYLNFMILYKPALIKYDKHVANVPIAPDQNPNADAYIIKYRKYGIVDAYYNQRAGIYVHKSLTSAGTGSN